MVMGVYSPLSHFFKFEPLTWGWLGDFNPVERQCNQSGHYPTAKTVILAPCDTTIQESLSMYVRKCIQNVTLKLHAGTVHSLMT